jgi:hypothetical protein
MNRLFILLFLLLTQVSTSDAQSWFNLRNGSDALNANSIIYTICADTNNNIFAAGAFTDSISPSYGYQYVAKWDATAKAWSKLGTGSNALNANWTILTTCADRVGNVYAAGAFTNGGGMFSGNSYVAKWDGISWNELGALNANGIISSICADRHGNIYAAGNFRNIYGNFYVAKWDGATWSDLGNLDANLYINAICVDDSQNVYAGGNFTDGIGKTYVAKYNPITNHWVEIGTGFDSAGATCVINSIFSDTPGHVCAAMNFYFAITVSSNVFKWNGSNWRQLGALDGNYIMTTICKGDSGFVYASGGFTNALGERYIARYDPRIDSWSQLGYLYINSSNYMNAVVSTMCTDKYGHLYAGGAFSDSMSLANNFQYVAEYGDPPPNLGISKAENEASLIVYPNPAQNYFNVLQTTCISEFYYLYNTTGVLCRKGQLDNITKIDINDLPPGLYYLALKDDLSRVYKIVKN